MLYIKLGKLILDENLKILLILTPDMEKRVATMFCPLTRDDAHQFLKRLWIETYAETHTPQETKRQRDHLRLKEAGSATYDYKYHLLTQIILCPKDCQRKPPHKHVDEKRRKLLLKKRLPKKFLL